VLLIGRAQGGPRMPDEGDEVVLVPYACQLETGVETRQISSPFVTSFNAGREELCRIMVFVCTGKEGTSDIRKMSYVFTIT